MHTCTLHVCVCAAPFLLVENTIILGQYQYLAGEAEEFGTCSAPSHFLSSVLTAETAISAEQGVTATHQAPEKRRKTKGISL